MNNLTKRKLAYYSLLGSALLTVTTTGLGMYSISHNGELRNKAEEKLEGYTAGIVEKIEYKQFVANKIQDIDFASEDFSIKDFSEEYDNFQNLDYIKSNYPLTEEDKSTITALEEERDHYHEKTGASVLATFGCLGVFGGATAALAHIDDVAAGRTKPRFFRKKETEQTM
ncbi:MAG: hypothetical protein IJA61_02505 [Clostridia bacterium]|nr:hypothetical protein [Clostridia bacterium]